jgi:hypothetical protein
MINDKHSDLSDDLSDEASSTVRTMNNAWRSRKPPPMFERDLRLAKSDVSDEARPLKASMLTSLAKSEASSSDPIMVHRISEVGRVRRSPPLKANMLTSPAKSDVSDEALPLKANMLTSLAKSDAPSGSFDRSVSSLFVICYLLFVVRFDRFPFHLPDDQDY